MFMGVLRVWNWMSHYLELNPTSMAVWVMFLEGGSGSWLKVRYYTLAVVSSSMDDSIKCMN